jgi:hypothetical protein
VGRAGPSDRLGVEQDRPGGAAGDGAVDGPPDSGWQWHERGLGALADHPQHPVAVFLAEVDDGRAGRFEDPQAEQCTPDD